MRSFSNLSMAVAIFAVAYALIITERVHKTIVAMGGAALMIVSGVLTQEEAFYSPEFGIYGVSFFEPGHEHGDVGLGNPSLFFEGRDGALAGANIPGAGSVGDIFLQAQFPLHSGRILG